MLLIKTDALGNEEWHSTYGRGINDEGRALEILPDGSGYVIAGNSTNGLGNTDILISKVDNNGTIIISDTVGNPNFNEEVSDLLIYNNTEIILAGSTSNVKPKEKIPGVVDAYDFFTPKRDLNLAPISWDSRLGYGGTDKAYGIAQNTVGDIIIFGTSDRSVEGDTNKGLNNFLVKTIDVNGTDHNGDLVTGNQNDQLASRMSDASNGEQIMVGTSVYDGGSDIFISRRNSAKNATGAYELSKVERTTGKAIVEARGGGYLILGSIIRNGNSDVYLVRTNTRGAVIWEKIFGGDNEDLPGDLKQLEDGSIVFTCTITLDNQQKIGLIKTNENGELKD